MKNLALALILSVSVPICVEAADASRLESALRTALEDSKTKGMQHGITISYDTELKIEDAGSYFAVTLPDISMSYPDGSVFDLGIIALNAMPSADQDGLWRMRAALPTPMKYMDAAGNDIITADLPSQQIDVLWHEDLNLITSLNAAFTNAALNVPLETGEGRQLIEIGSMTAKTGFENLNIDALQEMSSGGNFPGLAALFSSFSWVSEGSNILFKVSGPNGNSFLPAGKMEQARSTLSLTTDRNGTFDFAVESSGSGLESAMAEQFSSLGAPSQMRIRLALDDAPEASVLTLLANALQAQDKAAFAIQNPILAAVINTYGTAGADQPADPKALQAALSQAGAAATVTFDVADPGQYAVKNNIRLIGDATLPMGGKGEYVLNIAGYETMKAAVLDGLKSMDAIDPSQNLVLKARAITTLIETLGRQDTIDGLPGLTFTASASGPQDLTVNGQNMQQLMALAMPVMMMMGPPPAPADENSVTDPLP